MKYQLEDFWIIPRRASGHRGNWICLRSGGSEFPSDDRHRLNSISGKGVGFLAMAWIPNGRRPIAHLDEAGPEQPGPFPTRIEGLDHAVGASKIHVLELSKMVFCNSAILEAEN